MQIIGYFKEKPKRYFWVFGVIFIIILIAYGGYKGYDYAENYLDRLEKDKQQEIKKIKDSILVEKQKVIIELDSIRNIQSEISNYYNEYIREKNKNIRLQKDIDAI